MQEDKKPSVHAINRLLANYNDWSAFRTNKKITKKLATEIVLWMDPRVLAKLGSPVAKPGPDIWNKALDDIIRPLRKLNRKNPDKFQKEVASYQPKTQLKIRMVFDYFNQLVAASKTLQTINGLNETDKKIKKTLVYQAIERFLVEQVLLSYNDVKDEYRHNLSVSESMRKKSYRASVLLEKVSEKAAFSQFNADIQRSALTRSMFDYFGLPDGIGNKQGLAEVQRLKGNFAPAVWYISTLMEWPLPESWTVWKDYQEEKDTRDMLTARLKNVLDTYKYWAATDDDEAFRQTEAIHAAINKSYAKLRWTQSMWEYLDTQATFAEFNAGLISYTEMHYHLFLYFEIPDDLELEEKYGRVQARKGQFAPAIWYIAWKLKFKVQEHWSDFPDCSDLEISYDTVQRTLSRENWKEEHDANLKKVPNFNGQFFMDYKLAQVMRNAAESAFSSENARYLDTFEIPDDPRFKNDENAGTLQQAVANFQKDVLLGRKGRTDAAYKEDMDFASKALTGPKAKRVKQSDFKKAMQRDRRNMDFASKAFRLRTRKKKVKQSDLEKAKQEKPRNVKGQRLDESDSDSQEMEEKINLYDSDMDVEEEAVREGDSSEVESISDAEQDLQQQAAEFKNFIVPDDEYDEDSLVLYGEDEPDVKRPKIDACLSCGHLTPHSILHGTVTAPICNSVCRQRYWSKFIAVKSN